MSIELHLLCAGAVQGLVGALQAGFERETGAVLHSRFGAVGALREALLAGAPCDVMIVTESMLLALQSSGDLAPDAATPIGRVRTGVAVRSGEPHPEIATPAALKATLLGATAIYFPDPQRATAGIHVASVLDRLGIRSALAERCRNFPNGATSMRALADEGLVGAVGCTQASEILATDGVELVGPLTGEFELATTYSAGIGPRARQPELARRLIELLAGASSRAQRERCGIEPD